MVVPKTADQPAKKQKMKLRTSGLARFVLGPVGRTLIIAFSVIVIAALMTFTYFYAKYATVIDERLRAGVFANSAKIFAAPVSVAVGDIASPGEIAIELRRSGYTESRDNPIGYYQLRINAIEVFPRRDSYFDQEPGVIRFAGNKISQIVSLQDNTQRTQYQLEPQLIQAVSGPSREKRRMVKFHDIPKLLVDAVTAAEDKRFFQHAGFDPIRILKAAWVDLREGRKAQGASTLSMQTAKMFFLDTDKRWSRKAAETIITLQLEQKLTKEEIFEFYANQVPLGWRGTFAIRGFGEAAEVYLGKDLSQINLPEAAELAGMIQRPAAFDPYHHADKLTERRNVVLQLMRQNGDISEADYLNSTRAEVTVAKTGSSSVDAPYVVDMVNEALQQKFQDTDLASTGLRVYTTLDMRLQRAAAEAIRIGMQSVDDQIKRQRRWKGKTPPQAQVALIALDPHTGEIKALSGGRNYGVSQLNHVNAKRQPGSIFKPFVYAAALNTGLTNPSQAITISTTVVDEATTFNFDTQPPYSPKNFDGKFKGTITLRRALAESRNVPTVKVALMAGLENVVEMANKAGMNYKIQPTPSVALGSYEITPLEAAGAYTVFANGGNYVKPNFISLVRDSRGQQAYKNKLESHEALDPRVTYLTVNLMEEVMRSGTAAGVRAHYNLNIPVAGKTGTSHDGWFAGFTSELLCVVWVGIDDNSELDLEGAHSAAPIWAEFMTRALKLREYRDIKPFRAPNGIVSIDVDPLTGMPATPSCPSSQPEVFIAGTEPTGYCTLHGGRTGPTTVNGWDTTPPPAPPVPTGPAAAPRFSGSAGDGQSTPDDAARRAARQAGSLPPPISPAIPPPPEKQDDQKKQKKGIFQRFIGVFKGKGDHN
jgi:penicillin-binding protein 1B